MRRSDHTKCYKPSDHLNVDANKTQSSTVNPEERDMTNKATIKISRGESLILRTHQSQLDNVGHVQKLCGVKNSDDRLKRTKNQLELTNSIAEIKRFQLHTKALKGKEIKQHYLSNSSQDSNTLLKNYSSEKQIKGISKNEVSSMIWGTFSDFSIHAHVPKSELVRELQKRIESASLDAAKTCVGTDSVSLTISTKGSQETFVKQNVAVWFLHVNMLCSVT